MTFEAMKEKVLAAVAEAELDYEYVALRFENKARNVGDICQNSRHNPNREDERDFPAYSSEGYNGLPELDGTSGWELRADDAATHTWKSPFYSWDETANPEMHFGVAHCYIIAGNEVGTHVDADNGEVVIRDAVVTAIIF